MYTKICLSFVVFALLSCLFSNPGQAKNTRTTVGASETGQAVSPEHILAAEVFRLINEARRTAGVPALARDSALDAVATRRSEELVRRFAHTRPDGSPWSGILNEGNIEWSRNGENIAAGQKDAARVMADWMQSSGHRANILERGFTQVGVGLYRDPKGKTYWVQVFVGR